MTRRLSRRPAPAPRPAAVQVPVEGPTVSVIIPVYNVEKYIDACLTSLRAQTHRQLQIIIVDDGSTDGSAAIYRRHAAEDDRFLVLRQPNAGQGAARNHGLLLATGRYLTFLDPDDLLPANAYATLCATLERSGSDFAVGSILRVSHGAFSSTSWINVAHARDRIGITIDDFPEAVMDVICCNRMLRRSFWEGAQIRFPEGVAYEDHVPMMQAFVRAARFDVLRAVTYHWRTREDFTSTGQRKREVQNLRDRVTAKEQAAELLRDSSAQVRQAWLRRVLDVDLYGFLRQLEWAEDEYWEVLGAAVRRFLAEADSEVLDSVRVTRKVQAWLLAQDRREHLMSLLRWQRENPRKLPTEVRDGRVFARFPPLDAEGGSRSDGDIPEQILALTEDETRLSASLRRARVTDDRFLELEGWAHPRLVDLTGRSVQIEVALVEDRLGLRQVVPVEPRDAPEADRARERAQQSYRSSGFLARVDLEELGRLTAAAQPTEPAKGRLATWRLEVTSSVAGITRTAGVRSRDTRSSAGELPSVRVADGLALVPIMDRTDGLRIEVRRPRAVLTSLSVTGRRLDGTVRLPVAADAARDRLRLLVRGATGRVVTAELLPAADGQVEFTLELPQLSDDDWKLTPHERRLWTMQVLIGRRSERLAWSPDEPQEWWPAPDGAEIIAQCSQRGHVQLTETRDVAVVEDVLLGDDQVVVTGRWLSPPTGAWEPKLCLQQPGTLVWTAQSVREDGATFECVFALGVDERGRGHWPPPSGDYLLQFLRADGTVLRPRLSRDLVERTVLDGRAARCSLRLRRGGGRQVLLQVTAPLESLEESADIQRALLGRSLADPPELPELVADSEAGVRARRPRPSPAAVADVWSRPR